ncbi:MAG: thioredoxin family protein [Chloroflexota bacterium]|nr:thioredoxin family protein [Chloroflexota bacterium]
MAASQATEATAARALVPEAVGPSIEVYPAGALHVVGQERFAVGLVDPESGPIETGDVDLLFFKLVENRGTLTETLPAPFLPYGVREPHAEDHDEGSEITGIYVARPQFDAAGNWGVVARVTLPDGSTRAGQRAFAVEAENPLPGPGDAAILSKTLTADDPEEIAKICTADPVDNMHALSLDEAVTNGKPTVVLFATPALCGSRTCGPSLEAVQELQRRYGPEANFIHVEIYPGAYTEKPAAAMAEWDLPSEPWLFLIDTEGKVVERFEGGIGLTELDPAVQDLIR